MNTKKTAFGAIAATAAGLLAVGAASPAFADEGDTTTETTHSVTKILDHAALTDLLRADGGDITGGDTTAPVVISPEVSPNVDLGGVLNGDIASGNAVGSGNDTTAPILSGNDTDTSAPVGSGNSTDVSGGDVATDLGGVTTDVTDAVSGGDVATDVNGAVDGLVGDITGNVNDIVGDATSGIDLGAILGD